MTNERFNEILNGPLSHPLLHMAMNRLALALRVVVEETGAAGDAALEKIASEYTDKDGEDQDGEEIESQRVDLGPCCACEKTGRSVRNAIMLPLRAPIAGTGWGCLVCCLPSDGAYTVLCDECLGDPREAGFKRDPRWAVKGYISDHERIPIEELTELFNHDMSLHPGER